MFISKVSMKVLNLKIESSIFTCIKTKTMQIENSSTYNKQIKSDLGYKYFS